MNGDVGDGGRRVPPGDLPIGDYALLSDCQTAALVSRGGSVDWLCWPRFDAASTFGRLLDTQAGHWRICPERDAECARTYVDGTLVLDTTFSSSSGAFYVRDALILDDGARGHEIGKEVPHVLARTIVGLRGSMAVDVEFAPRPEYGKVRPLLRSDGVSVLSGGGATVLRLAGPPADTLDDGVARWSLVVEEGERVAFSLHFETTAAYSVEAWSEAEIVGRTEDTVRAWQSWSDQHLGYEGPWADRVRHSGRVLQALTYAPTGAVVAAPTTSLPEVEGGERNWDYRFTWLRDASLTMNALWVAACPDEAERFFEWILNASGASTGRGGLQVVYGVGGEHDLFERELGHLAGWRASRPVRIGNDASEQHQNDIFGEVLDAAHRLREQLDPLDEVTKGFLVELAEKAAEVWSSPDFGIWEARSEPQRFLYSTLLCWVALDRAIDMADWIDADDRVARWRASREEIRVAIVDEFWDEDLGAYPQTLGGGVLDASALMLAITGFHDAADEPMAATIEAVATTLANDAGLIYRYRGDDGLGGEEATFAICTFWLVECFALGGQLDRAVELFETACGYLNDVGLMSEELGPEPGVLLGNFPQAFSHIGLINAAQAIGRARNRETEEVSA